MSVVVNETFDADVGSFTGDITRVAAEGADFDTGYGSVTAGGGSNKTATRSFTAITSGVFRCDFWINLSGDSETVAGSTKNTLFYLLPTAGSVDSANSITTIAFNRDTGGGATSELLYITYRNAAGFQALTETIYRIGWLKVSVVANFTGDLFDLYLNDILVLKGAGWANTSAADFSRIAIINVSAAPATLFDEIVIQDAYSLPSESVIVEHDFQTGDTGEIEDLTPQTQTRTQHPQKWLNPADQTTYGAGTVGATNGLVPDSGKTCHPVTMCLPDGIVEGEFVAASSGTIYFGLSLRFWEDQVAGGGGLLRVSSVANTLSLQLPNGSGVLTEVASAALTPSAGGTYSIKCEMRGRYYICSYKNAALDSGSYTVAFTHVALSAATGGYGLLGQEYHGLYFASTGAATNYCHKFRFTGALNGGNIVKTIGDYKWTIADFSVHECYAQDVADTTIDLGGDAFIQVGHRSQADAGNRTLVSSTLYNTTNCLVQRRRSLCLSEYEVMGQADCWFTLLWRGPWIGDRITMGGATENFAPDHDFAPVGVWDNGYSILAHDAANDTNLTDTAFHDWREDIANDALPMSFQRVTNFATGNDVRFSAAIRNNENLTGDVHNLTHKYEGNGDPISQAVGRDPGDLVHGTAYECGRAYLLETAASIAIDETTLIRWRNNVGSPRALAFTTGAAKTDASGDIDVDGFSERHGWYEITCAGGVAEWTVEGATQPAEYPVFRLHSWTNTNTAVYIGGVLGVAGTDYLLDDMGGSVGVLQILSVLTSDTTIEIAAALKVGTRRLHGKLGRLSLVG